MSAAQVLTAGQSTALTCSVSQPVGLASSAVISWTKDGVVQSGECLKLIQGFVPDSADYSVSGSYPTQLTLDY